MEDPIHQQEEADEIREQSNVVVVRIYVASLADYNAGRLYGAWIDADQEPEALHADVQRVLDESPTPGAEEFAIFDYEGFGPLRLSEYESMEMVSTIAAGIGRHGPAFAHWASLIGSGQREELARFEEVYYGHVESLEEYAEEMLDELGYMQLLEDAVPEQFSPYVKVDVEGFARDLELSGDILTSQGDGGFYVFEGRA